MRVHHTDQLNWELFMNGTCNTFADAFIKEVNEVFEQLQLWVNFAIFDLRKLPKAKAELKTYGNEEFSELLSHYAVSKTDVFKTNRISPLVDTDFDKAKSEWSGFKDLMFQKHENYYHLIGFKNCDCPASRKRGQNCGNEFKKRTLHVLSKVTLGVILHWRCYEAAIPKPIFFVARVKYIPFECSLCFRTFFKDEVDKNTPEKPIVPSKTQSTSENWHRVT